MQINQNIIEVTGAAAQVWGNVLIPGKGKMSLKIMGDILYCTHKSGLEKKDSWTRIQNIDCVEIMEAPVYLLLGIGAFLCFSGLGGIFGFDIFRLILFIAGVLLIIYALLNKRRYLAIMSNRNTIAIFMTKSPEFYQQFSMNLLMIARQLNAPNIQNKTVRPQQNRAEAA